MRIVLTLNLQSRAQNMYLCENDKCCYRYSVPNNDLFIARAGQLLLACLCIS